MTTCISVFRRLWRLMCLTMWACTLGVGAQASPVNLGFLIFDITGTSATFDIGNLTGSNEPGFAPFYPVTTSVTFSSLSLVVTFDDSSVSAALTGFSLAPDMLSYSGPTVALSGGVLPVSAMLTGALSVTTLSLYDGSQVVVQASFLPVSLIGTGPNGVLQDGDAGLIQVDMACTPGVACVVPEPGSLLLVLGALGALYGLRFALRSRNQGLHRKLGAPLVALAVAWLPGLATAAPLVAVTGTTLPPQGLPGIFKVMVPNAPSPSSLPAPLAPALINVVFAPTCPAGGAVLGQIAGTGVTISAPNLITGLTSVGFTVPPATVPGTYFVYVSGVAPAGATPPGAFGGTKCSIMVVQNTTKTLNACVPTSSLAVALGSTVEAYVPRGYWSGGATGIRRVSISPPGPATTISTPQIVNSCASNPATGETVCTANNTDIYRLTPNLLVPANPPTLTTYTSGSNSLAGFSGGQCNNCGVAINALTNSAYIALGFTSPSGSGIQRMDLGLPLTAVSSAVLKPVFPLNNLVSENISIDPGRQLLLSPGENNNYGLVKLDAQGNMVKEYANFSIGAAGGVFDSAAEDCITGIGLTANEFTSTISMADLNVATLSAGGTWSAPSSVVTILDGSNLPASFSAGISGISVVPGTDHIGVATGEFGGQSLVVFKLPTTPSPAGSSTPPTLIDYVYVPVLPATPDGNGFAAGFDPHTIAAYLDPTGLLISQPKALIVSWPTGLPTYIAVLDLKQLLCAPRIPGTHQIAATSAQLLTMPLCAGYATPALEYVAS